MKLKSFLIASLAATAAMTVTTPASATWGHKHYCDCGHTGGGKKCGGSSSGGKTSSSSGGKTSSGGSSGGKPPSPPSGGTKVPEPGMVGMMGLGLLGVAFARSRRRRK